MSLDVIDDTYKVPKIVAPLNSILGMLEVNCPDYFDVAIQAGFEKKYIDGEYTVFVPKYIPKGVDRQTAYTFCRATTAVGKINPETINSSSLMIINSLDPSRFIGMPQSIKKAINCSNGWIYILS